MMNLMNFEIDKYLYHSFYLIYMIIVTNQLFQIIIVLLLHFLIIYKIKFFNIFCYIAKNIS